MKRKISLVAVLTACVLGIQAQVIQSYQVREAITLRMPILTDSINCEGRKYEAEDLLGTVVSLNQDNYATHTQKIDTAGFVTLAGVEGEHFVYVVSTQIRANRFVKGKLKVTSPVRWEIFVDGVSKLKKENVDDSIDVKTARDITLRLEPERNYEVALKLLVLTEDKVFPSF